MTKEQAIQEQIDEIMDSFEFEKVQNMMEALGWGWGEEGEAPDSYEMKRFARERLREAVKCGTSSSGGFTARYKEGFDVETHKPFVILTLYFGLQTLNDGTSYDAP
jgi:hypothetical protein